MQSATQLKENTIKQVTVHTRYTQYYPDRTKTEFHETHKCSTAICADLLYRISSELHDECGKQG
jgi:hypothetical protein